MWWFANLFLFEHFSSLSKSTEIVLLENDDSVSFIFQQSNSEEKNASAELPCENGDHIPS